MCKLIVLVLSYFVIIAYSYGQTFIISSLGKTSTPGANWSVAGNTLTVKGTANIRASVIENHLHNTFLLMVDGIGKLFFTTISSIAEITYVINLHIKDESNSPGSTSKNNLSRREPYLTEGAISLADLPFIHGYQ